MEIFEKDIDGLQKTALILGFFDGIHRGHRSVISSAVNYAKLNNANSVLLTLKNSPSEYFNKPAKYIYPRKCSYKIIEGLGVDYIIEKDFNELANISAEDYLREIVRKYHPISISTGFNYTFGKNKFGTSDMLKEGEKEYGYKYFLSLPELDNKGQIISSTSIKKLLHEGKIKEANSLLEEDFHICSTVIKGMMLGRKLGFPTANLNYPDTIKIPYGVYKAETLGKPSVLNFGIKPTVSGKEEVAEVHILDFDGDLYGKTLEVKIISKIRDEKKFNNLEELKTQIERDIQVCLK